MKTLRTVTLQSNNHKQFNGIVLTKKNPLKEMPRIRKRECSELIIQGNSLRNWLDTVNSSNGIYFLDISKQGQDYSINFKDHNSGKLLRMDYEYVPQPLEDKEKMFIECLLFDLILFKGDEPIIVFDRKQTEAYLINTANKYFEFAKQIDEILGRLIDMSEVFALGWYQDSRIEEVSINGVYHGLYPGSSIDVSRCQGAFGMYLIYRALQNIFQQILNLKSVA